MNNSINESLLPVRTRVEYELNPEKGWKERVCYLECANGEILTGNLPFAWMQYIASAINHKYIGSAVKEYNVSNPIALIRIDGLPIQRSDSQIIGKDSKGKLSIAENPLYTESIKKAEQLGEELFLERWCQLPIRDPIMVSCIYNINGRTRYNIAKCNAWVIDLLDRLNIIYSKSHHVVKSMNGSRFRTIKEPPFVLVIIRKVEGKEK